MTPLDSNPGLSKLTGAAWFPASLIPVVLPSVAYHLLIVLFLENGKQTTRQVVNKAALPPSVGWVMGDVWCAEQAVKQAGAET